MKAIKIIELIGTSKKSWEDAANNAVEGAAASVEGITGVEVVGQTAKVKNGKIIEYKTTIKIAFLVKD